MATGGQFYWPSVGTFVAAYGQFSMAANTSPPRGWMLDACILSEVHDLTEVYQWIEEHARGRRFELFVEMQEEPLGPFTSPRKSDLIRLLGRNPNAGESVHIATFVPI